MAVPGTTSPDEGNPAFEMETTAVLGDANAPVTVYEFSDYQCPFCLRHFQQTLPTLIAEYVDTGKVRYIFKDFPLSSIHPQAQKAAEAAECAGVQGAYWSMHDRIFAGQAEWNGKTTAVETFVGYAEALGLDVQAFRTCLESGQFTSEVQSDFLEGRNAAISGTPTFFIDGLPVVGAVPYDTLRQVIEAALAAR